ncbi:hypothetical protein, partial [Aquamicrobium sp.]|uniref:hypothetical protein n=1 Tax=Aquamicrobium sp. TaxID=1872579 RepID=UPI002585772F
IGLLLRMEEYEKRAGGTAWRPTLAFSFQAETELMASEILSRKATPEQLPRVLVTLADKPLRGGSGNGFDAANRAAAAAAEFDEIPY